MSVIPTRHKNVVQPEINGTVFQKKEIDIAHELMTEMSIKTIDVRPSSHLHKDECVCVLIKMYCLVSNNVDIQTNCLIIP